MKLMKNKLQTRMIVLVFVAIYLIFPTTVFYGEHNKLFENASPDNSFKVVVYKTGVYNIYSLYKYINNEGYFFVVYDKCANVVFKPSLWFGASQSVVYGGFYFSKHDRNKLFFPTNEGGNRIGKYARLFVIVI
ncbi:hypothetical protein SAMN04487787_10858 [Kosakonia sacchari]|nr:hypothetical protein SAMN04487787_10858 [Kosakonia sacchari]